MCCDFLYNFYLKHSSLYEKMSEISYKGKAIPLQACTGPEGSGSLSLPDFKIKGTCRW